MSQTQAPAMKKSLPWMFFVAMVAQMIGGTIAGSYLVFYMTERMLITATVVGSILLISRIVDLIIGLLSGVIVQKVCFKHGQYRSWLLYGPLAVSIGTTMCFINPAIPVMAKAVIVFVGYLLYGGGMSFIQISQNGSLAKIAGPDMATRLNISSKMVQGQSTGTIITSMITLPLILWIDAMGPDGYTTVQVAFALIGFIGQLSLFMATKEFDKFDPDFKNKGGATVSLTHMIGDTLKNSQIIIVMLGDMLRFGALMTLMSLAMYYFTYVVKQPLMMSTSMTIQSVFTLLCAFVSPQIVKKIGKKTAAICTGILGIIGYGCMAMFAIRGPMFYIIANTIAVAGSSLINVCGVNLYLDCAEYQLYKSGKDNRTFAMSMFGIAIKLGFIIASVLTAFVLNSAGYNEITKTLADPDKFVMLIGGIPAVFYVLYTILFLIYKITEDKSREYADHNYARMQQQQAESSQ